MVLLSARLLTLKYKCHKRWVKAPFVGNAVHLRWTAFFLFTFRWLCSTILLRYFTANTSIIESIYPDNQRRMLIVSSAAAFAPLLSITTLLGNTLLRIALSKNARAAGSSRFIFLNLASSCDACFTSQRFDLSSQLCDTTLVITLCDVANSYKRDAERIIS